MEGLLQKHTQAVMDTIPVRAGDVSPTLFRAAEQYQGRYKTELRDIVEHGEYKLGNWRLRAVDLWMAKALLDKANDMKSSRIGFAGEEKVKPAAEDLNTGVKLVTSRGAAAGGGGGPS